MKRAHKILLGAGCIAVIAAIILLVILLPGGGNTDPIGASPAPNLGNTAQTPDNLNDQTPDNGSMDPDATETPIIRLDMSVQRPIRNQNATRVPSVGSIASCDDFIIGVRSDGKVFIAGYTLGNAMGVVNQTEVVKAVTNGTSTLALCGDGSVYIYGTLSGLQSELSDLSGVCDIALGDDFAVCLLKDGNLAGVGDLNGELGEFSDIVAITAYGENMLSIAADGSVKAYGDSALKTAVADWSDAVQVELCDTHAVMLKSDGSVKAVLLSGASDEGQLDLNEFTDVARVYVKDGLTVAVSAATGALMTSPEIPELGEIRAAEQVCFAKDAYFVLHTDGGISIIGEAEDRMKNCTNWQLKCYVEDNYYMGFLPGTSAKNAALQISSSLGVKSVYFKRPEGARMVMVSDDECIATGMTVFLNGKESGYVVIKGDIDGDGLITEKDADMIIMQGDRSEVQQLACRFNGYSDVAAESFIRNAAAGKLFISQFPQNGEQVDMWDKFIGARAINSDVLGYISIDNTIIDYPILWDANFFYNDHDINKNSTGNPGAGSIYTYYSIPGRNTTITGHNMRTAKTMFHALHTIQDNKEALISPENRIIKLILWGEYSEWEIFALYETPHEEPVTTITYNTKLLTADDEMGLRSWIMTQLDRSEVDTGIVPGAADRFVTLVTCGDEYGYDTAQSRLYIFLRRIA